MSWFSRHYDQLMRPIEQAAFWKLRSRLIAQAEGEVLEIGSGTGVNFPLYRGVKLMALEPDETMRTRSLERASKSAVPITVVDGDAEALPFSDDRFDTVVGTLVLCTIPDAGKALQEIRRVCKPGGRILLFEHVRMRNPLGLVQDALTPVWKRVCDGCRLNRNTLRLLNESGIRVEQVESHYRGLFLVIVGVNSEG